MKQLVEFTKISEEELPQIYCDMDQVLCDFIGGAEKVLGTSFDKAPKEARWEKIKDKKDFWHTLGCQERNDFGN